MLGLLDHGSIHSNLEVDYIVAPPRRRIGLAFTLDCSFDSAPVENDVALVSATSDLASSGTS